MFYKVTIGTDYRDWSPGRILDVIFCEANTTDEAFRRGREVVAERNFPNPRLIGFRAQLMRYYPHTVAEFAKRLLERFPDARPERDLARTDPGKLPGHLLWMMSEMQNFEQSKKKTAKAGRWIGWIAARMEILGLVIPEEERRLAKRDSDEDFI